MKKIILAVAMAIVTAVGMSAASVGDSYTIDREQLPAEAQAFLTRHFPKAKVGMIKVDRHLLKKTDYDVRLTDGTTIEFKNNGKWESVDCGRNAVPDAIIPKAILDYVKKKGNGASIVKIEKESWGYEIELSDRVEMKFDLLGNFKSAKIDD